MRDVLLQTSTIIDMGTKQQYLAPLREFKKRIAVANAYKTDCLVSTSTAAFLSASSRTLHHCSDYYSSSNEDLMEKHDAYALSVTTTPSQEFDTPDMSQNLDAIGWTKVMLDVRDAIPLPAFPNPFADNSETHNLDSKTLWTSEELINSFDRFGNHWKLPFGHPVACASYKNGLLRWFTTRGAPIMDQLAQDLLTTMTIA